MTVVRVIIRLYMTPKSVKLSCIFLDLDSILAEIFGGHTPSYSLAVELVTKFLWITSEKIVRSLVCAVTYIKWKRLDIFKTNAFFVASEFCDWVQFGIDVRP